MSTQTPDTISKDIQRLCNKVSPGQHPVYVDVTPDSEAAPNQCFPNTAKRVAESGGCVVHGWQVWEWLDVLVEAEFHGVWQRPDGSLVDITPKECPIARILFLPDPRRHFEGRQVDNVRLPLTNDPNVIEFIALSEERYRIMNKGDRADQSGLVRVPRSEIEPLYRRMAELRPLLDKPSPRRESPCHCGSGRKYRKCCGKPAA